MYRNTIQANSQTQMMYNECVQAHYEQASTWHPGCRAESWPWVMEYSRLQNTVAYPR